jgi:DNA-binding protein
MPEPTPVLVGKKPVFSYVLAALTQFQNGSDKVVIKARGRAISKAVDVAQILTKRFEQLSVKVSKIDIGTEQLKNPETGQVSNVSTIEITVSK